MDIPKIVIKAPPETARSYGRQALTLQSACLKVSMLQMPYLCLRLELPEPIFVGGRYKRRLYHSLSFVAVLEPVSPAQQFLNHYGKGLPEKGFVVPHVFRGLGGKKLEGEVFTQQFQGELYLCVRNLTHKGEG